jgi:hypothetical protein
MARAFGECAGLGGRPFSADELGHLASCAPCREALAASDPTALFSTLALERKDDSFWLGFETRVLAGIREQSRTRSGLLARLVRPRLALLAGGAALIAVVTLVARGGALPGTAPGGGIARAGGAHARPDAPLGAIDWVAGAARAVLGEEGPGREPAPAPEPAAIASLAPGWDEAPPLELDAAPPAPVETVSSPTAHIISLSIEPEGGPLAAEQRAGARQAAGAAVLPAASDVVLIVDREMDI